MLKKKTAPLNYIVSLLGNFNLNKFVKLLRFFYVIYVKNPKCKLK